MRLPFSAASCGAHVEWAIPGHAEISAKDVVVEIATLLPEIQIAKTRIPDFMVSRIQIRYLPSPRLLRPVAARVLAQKMIIIRLVHHESNLGRGRWAPGFKGAHLQDWVVSKEAGDHIRARLRLIGRKSSVARRPPRLMKRRPTDLLPGALANLLWIIYIHRIRETVMRLLNSRTFVPSLRLVEWLRS